jgi:hypothetical protein
MTKAQGIPKVPMANAWLLATGGGSRNENGFIFILKNGPERCRVDVTA